MCGPPRCSDARALCTRSTASQGQLGSLPMFPGSQDLTVLKEMYSCMRSGELCEAETTSYSQVIRDGTPVHHEVASLTHRTASQGHYGVEPALLGPQYLTVSEEACSNPNPQAQ